jgi:hypothetical protein
LVLILRLLNLLVRPHLISLRSILILFSHLRLSGEERYIRKYFLNISIKPLVIVNNDGPWINASKRAIGLFIRYHE